jgi:aryl-alcohol dehydrogenase-like predicted oxidoreductase
VTPDALALSAGLAQPWADVVLSGATTVDQLRSNLVALELDLDAELVSELTPLAEDREGYWTKRSALPWN